MTLQERIQYRLRALLPKDCEYIAVFASEEVQEWVQDAYKRVAEIPVDFREGELFMFGYLSALDDLAEAAVL